MSIRTDARGHRAPACYFVTLGCAKNEVDTDRMRALLLNAGFVEVQDTSSADVIIINTCSFLGIATQESVETTLELAQISKEECHARLIMCGCVPSRYGDELIDELPEVDAFVPSDEEDGIVNVVRTVLGIESNAEGITPNTLRTIQGASAYVKISDGCDRFCSFCAIPYIRGRYASRDAEEILDEVHALMTGGVREVVLIGQDTGIWGSDFGDERDLAWLLRRVAEVVRPYGGWIRVLYLQPEGMSDDLIDVLAHVDEVLPYIDIPVQHCVAHVLRDMNRRGSEHELRSLFERLREEIPGVVLRTTGLVGFPGETEEDFERLEAFIEDMAFDYVSVFAFSPEEGTVAAGMAHQVEDAERLERAQRLQDVAERLGFMSAARRIGQTVEVIIDGIESSDEGVELIGHAWFQAPDCDGVVHIASGEAAVGERIRCKLVDSFCYELVGVVETPQTGE